MKAPTHHLSKRARTELARRGITPQKGIFLYQEKLGMGYVNGKKLEAGINETRTKVKA